MESKAENKTLEVLAIVGVSGLLLSKVLKNFNLISSDPSATTNKYNTSFTGNPFNANFITTFPANTTWFGLSSDSVQSLGDHIIDAMNGWFSDDTASVLGSIKTCVNRYEIWQVSQYIRQQKGSDLLTYVTKGEPTIFVSGGLSIDSVNEITDYVNSLPSNTMPPGV